MAGTRLDRLQIHHVRNLEQVALQDLQRINVFYGRNGSGKTSVLEAVHLLAMARSFRGTIRSLVTHGQQATTVYGQKNPGSLSVGVRRDLSGEVRIKIGGEPVRTVAVLAEQLPVQVINADSFDLLTGAPGARRQYLDWGVFHVEHRFFGQWQRFQRGLKQRNKLLRHGKIDAEELAVWTRELATSGEALTDYRNAYFQVLIPRFQTIMAQLMPGLSGLELRFRQGWDKQSTYAEALASSDGTDREQGFTHVGPQRADIRVLVDGHLAAETLSRGQQKLLVCGLKLAQGQLMAEMGEKHCIYLVDDLPSELDVQHSERVCCLLDALDTQVFITCVQKREIAAAWPRSSAKDLAMFHVEHGQVVREDT